MPVLKYRPYVGAPWQVVGVPCEGSAGLLPQIIVRTISGSVVTCSKGDIVLNVEESNGTWVFNIPEYGEWTIATSVTSKTINIDSVKQYMFEDQFVNYTMLYDLGDECTELTGGWVGDFADSQYTYGGSYSKKSNYLYLDKTQDGYSHPMFKTNKAISLTGYAGLAFNATYYWKASGASTLYAMGFGMRADDNNSHTDGAQVITRVWYYGGSGTQSNKELFFSGEHDSSDFGEFSSLGNRYLYLGLYGGQTGDTRGNLSCYNIMLFKEDDWAKLCSFIGATAPEKVTELLSDADKCAQILNSSEAVKYMCLVCTGEFMVNAIDSPTFLTALEASPYKDLVYANEHWAKFLAMVQ